MTSIRPSRKSFLNRILVILGFCIVLASFWLVVIYNNLVNLKHDILDAKSRFDGLQAENAELKSRVLALLDSPSLESAASGLVREKNPEYLEIDPKWSFASER